MKHRTRHHQRGSVQCETPANGIPFEILLASFESDEHLWDAKFVIIGAKMGRPGYGNFPQGLCGLQEKLYVSRDGASEHARRRRG